MSSTIEIKEQIKALQLQERESQKLLNKKKKDYERYKFLLAEHPVFGFITDNIDNYDSFEALIADCCYDNDHYNKTEFELIFLELGFKDTEFFSAFMSWDKETEFEKCCICYDYYNKNNSSKNQKKMRNCRHHCCYSCYLKLNMENEYKICMICRKSEKPRV
jgi:hypothetical protein